MRRTATTMAAVGGALVVGVALGRWTAPVPAPAKAPAAATIVVPGVDATCPEAQACEAQLAIATGLLEAGQAARYGTPVPFPDDLPEAYEPEAFEANVRRALVECPDLGLELGFIDCSEYPCWAWFTPKPGAPGQDLQACDWWNERYTNPGQSRASNLLRTPTGDRHFSGIAERPPGSGFGDDNAALRFDLRIQEATDRFADSWDGRKLTERESLESSLPFWRDRADAGDEQAETMLSMLEEQLAAMKDDPEDPE